MTDVDSLHTSICSTNGDPSSKGQYINVNSSLTERVKILVHGCYTSRWY